MSSIKRLRLRMANDLEDVADLVGFKKKSLAYLLYGRSPDLRYKKFSIPKSSGGTRDILAPMDELKLVQKRLAGLLQDFLVHIEEQEKRGDDCIISHGFKKNLSIATNAKNHLGRRWVFNLDLEEFFPSINFGRVRGYFIKNRYFALNPSVATILAQIACHDNQLPQGAPTSPVISNLVAGPLDIRLNKLASKNRCSYTRYADDITFSTNLAEFPTSIGRKNPSGRWEASNTLAKRVVLSGFKINASKTRMQYKRSRQDVTGLIVNSKIGVKREVLKQVRARVNNLVHKQFYSVNGRVLRRTKNKNIPVDILQGQLSHISWIKGRGWLKGKENKCARTPKIHWNGEPGFVRTYRKFLDYTIFAINPVPVILCEGKTDNIYLQCSISILANAPKNLRNSSPSAFSKVGVRLFQYNKTASWIQRLGGGSGDLKEFVAAYDQRMDILGVKKFRSPVVVVVDNDDGVKKGDFNAVIKNKLEPESKTKKKSKKKSGLTIDGSKDFYHIGRNLYVVHTPNLGKKIKTEIEDFLPSSVRKEKLRGKTFEPDEEKFDRKKNFGKYLLAKEIVLQKKSRIDFTGFLPLLQRISKAIDHFDAGPFKAP